MRGMRERWQVVSARVALGVGVSSGNASKRRNQAMTAGNSDSRNACDKQHCSCNTWRQPMHRIQSPCVCSGSQGALESSNAGG